MAEDKKIIYLVDDELTSLMLGKKILAEHYEVFTMDSGAAFLEFLKKGVPDLILLDVEMPEMNGYETIKIIKSDEKTKDIPVIFLTAKADEYHELKGLSLGAMDYITKPFSKSVLLKRVEMHLNMAAEIKNYIERQLKTERKLTESRISIMLSQIQPHFLYNALEVISSLCYKDPALAEKAIANFSNYLRTNMNLLEQMEPIPFENELNHTINFINLEKSMYGEALKVIYDIPIKNFKIPALTVQPIVENAIKHGIGKKEDGGTVTISTRETERGYQIIISDDGVGFITDKIVDDGKRHIGISNVRLRLSLQCEGRLDIESKPGVGTTSTIFIPKIGNSK